MKKEQLRRVAFMAIVLVFPFVSIGKYGLYELTGAAPRLRNSIGKTIVLPQEMYRVNGKDVAIGEASRGVLLGTSYRWNDKIGFFDLKVDYIGGSKGLSPFEARRVKIVEPQQTSRDDSLKAALNN